VSQRALVAFLLGATVANGIILWQGASLLDGAPIVVIATGLKAGSENAKTGNMLQTFILRADIEPTAAIKSGADSSICGACPHRGDGTGKGRTCYVNVGQGPLAVYRAFKRGVYPDCADATDSTYEQAMVNVGAGRIVRLGTYGDPAAVPFWVWESLTSKCIGHTGYTHQWRSAPALRSLCMASADSETDAREAHAAGWRTFRVAMPCDSPRIETEVRCPASAEAGKKLTCAQCLACSGATGKRGSIVIQAHGGFAVMANVRKRQ
jgi:hypothetical protein